MTTQLQYFDDSFCFESHGVVTFTGRDDRGTFVILDRTIFYPQGGGQMADKGHLISHCSAETRELPVTYVGFRDGQVLHYLPEGVCEFVEVGHSFTLRVDRRARIKNARLHTAGHLVCHVLETIEPSLVPIKGYHFHDGPYVEFINNRSVDVSRILGSANSTIGDEVQREREVRPSFSSFETIETFRPHLAPFIPRDKPSRIVSIAEFVPLPCGGTHLTNLKQVGTVRVTKSKRVKENIRVSYEVIEPSD